MPRILFRVEQLTGLRNEFRDNEEFVEFANKTDYTRSRRKLKIKPRRIGMNIRMVI